MVTCYGHLYLQIPPYSKRYTGQKWCTLPFTIDGNLKEDNRSKILIVSKFETIEHLQKLRNIANYSNKIRQHIAIKVRMEKVLHLNVYADERGKLIKRLVLELQKTKPKNRM